MRRCLLLLWLIAPALLLAWHLGGGQRQLLMDRAAAQRERSHAAAAEGDWATAATAAGEALATLAQAEAPDAAPDHDGSTAGSVGAPANPRALSPAVAALTLDQARARIHQGELLEGIVQLDSLVDGLSSSSSDGGSPASSQGTSADPARQAIAREARHELASASYAAAWLMRLEGASPDEWKPDAEQARQQFRMLAEDGGALADPASRNLEATVRLERMDLSELQGLPLPSNCKCNSKNLSQRRRQQRESHGHKPNPQQQQKKDEDAREQIKQQTNAAGQQARSNGDGS